MKKTFILLISLLFILIFPFYVKGVEYKSLQGDFHDEIVSIFQNENTNIPSDITFVRYLQDEEENSEPLVAYSMDYSKEYIPSLTNPINGYNYIVVDNLVSNDYGAGLQYIIQNGFHDTNGYYVDNVNYSRNQVSNKVSNMPLNNKKWYINYWITQVAIWWYQDEINNTNYISNDFKNFAKSSNATEIGEAIYKLVDEAISSSKDKSLKEIELVTTRDNLILDGNSYKSDFITIVGDNIDNFEVTIINNDKYHIYDESGHERSTFNKDERFIVIIPEEEVSKVEDITLRVDAIKKTNTGYRFINGVDEMLIAIVSGEYNVYGTVNLHVNWIKPTRNISVSIVDSETNKIVSVATLELVDSNNTVYKEFNTTNNRVVIENIPYGKYKLRAKKSPDGYLINNEEIDILINNQTDMLSYVDIKANPLKTIRITKMDSESKNKISGSIIDILDSENKLVKEITTTNTYVDVKDLSYGTYKIVEKNDFEKIITIDNKSPLIVDVIITNTPLKSISVATINDDDKSIISGVSMSLCDQEGNIIANFTSDKERVVIDNLSYGTYSIIENNVPYGYRKIDNLISFKIDDNSDDITLIDIPYIPYYGVKVYKLDGTTMKPIKGALLEILNISGEVIKTIETTDDFVLIDDLKKGVYTIREVKAPKGYALSNNQETFEVGDKEELIINFINSDVYVPITGSSSKLCILSIVALLLGIGVIFLTKKRFN